MTESGNDDVNTFCPLRGCVECRINDVFCKDPMFIDARNPEKAHKDSIYVEIAANYASSVPNRVHAASLSPDGCG